MECGPQDSGSAQSVSIEGHKARHDTYHLRKIAYIPASFPDGFAEAIKIETLKISKPPMDDTEAVRACRTPEIILFEKQGTYLSSRCFQGKHDAVYATPDDNQIVLIPCSGNRIPEDFSHQIIPFSLYHAAVAARPSLNPTVGVYPNKRLALSMLNALSW